MDVTRTLVDASRAGFGNLEIAIKDDEGVIIPSQVSQVDSADSRFMVSFTPTKPGPHTVNITFNEEVLKSRSPQVPQFKQS